MDENLQPVTDEISRVSHVVESDPEGKVGPQIYSLTLQWRHNEHHGVSTIRKSTALFCRMFRLTSKKTSKPALLGIQPPPPKIVSQRNILARFGIWNKSTLFNILGVTKCVQRTMLKWGIKYCSKGDQKAITWAMFWSVRQSWRVNSSFIVLGLGSSKVPVLALTHLPLVPHICVSELCQHWFR